MDSVFNDFANAIEKLIRSGRTGKSIAHDYGRNGANNEILEELRRKAIEAALALTSGAYQTSLVSYFTHRDLFPALMKVCNGCLLLNRFSRVSILEETMNNLGLLIL